MRSIRKGVGEEKKNGKESKHNNIEQLEARGAKIMKISGK